MPSRYRTKTYVKDGHYHIFNRGVEKRTIFLNDKDYKVFLSYLKTALSPKQNLKNNIVSFSLRGRSFKAVPRQPKNFNEKIDLIAYCLVPNHFHLLIKQHNKKAMESFVRSLITRYSMYFNKRYERIGPLFQGRYKAKLITTDPYLLHLTRYIHRNPLEHSNDLENAYSSYSEYLGKRNTKWIKPDIVLKFFNKKTILELKKINSYKQFVEDKKIDSEKVLGKLTID